MRTIPRLVAPVMRQVPLRRINSRFRSGAYPVDNHPQMLIVKCGDQELQNPALSIASGGSSGVLPRAHSTRHFYNNHNTEKNNPGSEEGPKAKRP